MTVNLLWWVDPRSEKHVADRGSHRKYNFRYIHVHPLYIRLPIIATRCMSHDHKTALSNSGNTLKQNP